MDRTLKLKAINMSNNKKQDNVITAINTFRRLSLPIRAKGELGMSEILILNANKRPNNIAELVK